MVKSNPYDEIAPAIGSVCLGWGAIEDVIQGVCLGIAALIDPAFEQKTVRDTINLMFSNMDVRTKISTAKILAHHINSDVSPDFYDRTEELLNFVDNVLRPERNRFVHDVWSIDGQAIVRWKLGAAVKRSQSRQRELTTSTPRRFNGADEIHRFGHVLDLAYDDLATLESHIAWLISHQEKPSEFRQPLPAEWRSFAHREWLVKDSQSRPPQSSEV